MSGYRRAVPAGASPAVVTVARAVLVGLSSALVGTLGVLGFLSLRMARRVVTPGGRVPDTRIVAVDPKAQTITLTRTPDTELPGRYGLFTVGTTPYVKLGSVLASDTATVTRKLLTHVAPPTTLAPEAAFSGWYYDDPEQLQLPFHVVDVDAPVGPCPAWVFPAESADTTWAIQIHGRGTTRAECLRAVPVFHAAGWTTMVVSYRNDGDAPRSRAGAYGLGSTEWHDADAAITYARSRGAERIVLMGWSMGGAIALQLALESGHRDILAGVVLESPVVDWRRVLAHQARILRLPAPLTSLAIGALRTGWTAPLAGADAAIPFDRLDALARADELEHPILLLHSDADDFVPGDASVTLASARPDLIELHRFPIAGHTKLWNYDAHRWTSAIAQWLDKLDAARIRVSE